MNWRWIIPRQRRRRWKGGTTYRQKRLLQNLIIPTPHPPEDNFQIFHLPDRVKGLHDLDLPDCAKNLNGPDDDINGPRLVPRGANGRALCETEGMVIVIRLTVIWWWVIMMYNIIKPHTLDKDDPNIVDFSWPHNSPGTLPGPQPTLRNVGEMWPAN